MTPAAAEDMLDDLIDAALTHHAYPSRTNRHALKTQKARLVEILTKEKEKAK